MANTTLVIQYNGVSGNSNSGPVALDIMLTYPHVFIRHSFNTPGDTYDVSDICSAADLNRNPQWKALRAAGTFSLLVTAGTDDVNDVGAGRLAPAVGMLGVPFVIRVPLVSGGSSGTADDVAVFAANAPFKFRIVRSWAVISTAVASSTLQSFSQVSGGGSVLGGQVSSGAVGPADESGTNFTVTQQVAQGGSVYVHRSDRSVVGEFFMLAYRH